MILKKYQSVVLNFESHTSNFDDDYATSEVSVRATSFILVNDNVFNL